MSSLHPSYQQEIDALIKDLQKVQPKDLLQHCANYFHRRLEHERSNHLSSPSSPTSNDHNNNMTDTEGPFGSRARASNYIDEDDEERDTFGGSPTASKKNTGGSSMFNTSSPFGAASGGSSAGGGLFGNWMGGQSSEDAALTTQNLPSNFGTGAGRRTSVSAESMQPDADSSSWKPPKHYKTEDQLHRLKVAVAKNFLFSQLDEDSFAIVLDALVEKSIPAPQIKVISQGDEGDYFYVVESGDFDVYINSSGAVGSGPEGMGNKVASIGPGGSFGELALMYNAPRAATIASAGKGMLWALDRMTFRRILMTSASERRKMYEGFLEDVPLLSSLKPYERAKIADALESVKFSAGDHIIHEGEPGENFYMLEAGEASAFKSGVEKPVKEYTRGDYFGELALLDNKPRAASVIAKTNVKVAKLGRDGFKRLLGPVESIMRREDYDAAAESQDPLSRQKTVT